MKNKKENGRWEVDIRTWDGKRIQRTFDTLTEARNFEASIVLKKATQKQINNGLRPPRHNILEELKIYSVTKTHIRPRSIQKFNAETNVLKNFLSAFGIEYLDQCTSGLMDRFFYELIKERKDPRKKSDVMVKAAPKTVNSYLATAKAFFKYEVDKGFIIKNPMAHIKNLKLEKRPPEFYSEKELTVFFAQDMLDDYRDAFMCFLLTGVRFGECANLEWSDIDFQRGLMRIEARDGFTPKSASSNRVIPIHKDLFQIILRRSEKRPNSRYVFTSSEGCQLRERKTLEKCKEIGSGAGITSRLFIHKFRHTFATMLVLRGVSIQNIKELLGHSSVKETERYAHNKADHLFLDVSRLDNLIIS